MERADVVVIGAGIAGLVAARELRRGRRRVVVLEARPRIGGRILTLSDARVPAPIELGAEFIHGAAPHTRRLLREAALLGCDIRGDHFRVLRGKLVPRSLTGAVDEVLRHIDRDRPDEPFARFLARRPGGRRLARARVLARDFVQGFHAADAELVGTHSLVPEAGPPTESVSWSARVTEGYGRLVEWLARDVADAVRLDTTAREVAWERGRVEVACVGADGSQSTVAARAAVVTVPLGVLQAPPDASGRLAIRPEPPTMRRALDGLAMGPVTRIVFWLRELPWNSAKPDPKLRRLAFLRTTSMPFRVWWTPYPSEWPLLVAWCGGPSALLHRHEASRDVALRGLADELGISRSRMRSLVQGVWSHDWNDDPFSRGAYSYARVGGAAGDRLLARPVQQTLFFAGEATDGEQRGTVEGAIASGRRAARRIAAALRA